MKKIILYPCIFIFVFLIYFFNVKRTNYLYLGDNSSFNNFIYNELKDNRQLISYNDYFNNKTIHSLIMDVKNNRTIRVNSKDYYLKKELRESDILIINIGQYELAKKYHQYNMRENEKIFNNIYMELENLVNEIKRYTQGKILFIGLYNPTNYYDSNVDIFFYQVNLKINKLMKENNIIYIDLYELIKSGQYKNQDNYQLNSLGLKKLTNIIKKYVI